MKRIAVVTLLAFGSQLIAQGASAQTVPATETGAIQQPQQDVAQPPVEQTADAPKPEDQAPKHVSTGWSALFKDTVRDFKHFPMRQSTWVILGVGGAASYGGHFGDDYVQEHIGGNTNADHFFSLGKFIGGPYVMAASSVGLWAVGRYIIEPDANGSKTNKWSGMGFDMMRAQLLAQTVTHGTKIIVRRDRPSGECCSFPSGHAASAFAAAAVLERHLGYRGSWPFMVGATYVATSRLVDNRHFLSDVILGAAVGTAAGWTVISSKANGNHAYIMQPMPVGGGMMIAVSRVPR